MAGPGGDTTRIAVEIMELYLDQEILPRFIGRSIVSTFLLEIAIQDAGLPEEIERYRPNAKAKVLKRAMENLGAEPFSKVGHDGVNAWVLPKNREDP